MKLLLFDIDGTLLLSGGAGLRAMNRAFERLYGVPNILEGISLSGRTDDKIMRDAFAKAGVALSTEALEKFKQTYFSLIEEELKVDSSHKRLMPGIAELLSLLSEREDIFLGLLTGNWETSGRAKLAYFDLNKYFPFGAFSDDSSHRPALVPIAIERFVSLHGIEPKQEQVYVIGDTPSDIQCAKANGVISVAVAAAGHSEEELSTHNPDLILQDLMPERALDILG